MMKNALISHLNITPQFYDIDPMNVVWHGNYIRYFEEARSVLLDKIGYNYKEMVASGFAWPIVDLRTKYIKPLTLHQKVRVSTTLVEFENRLKIDYIITEIATNNVLTKATTVQVAVDMSTQEMCFETPEIFQSAVKKSLEELAL